MPMVEEIVADTHADESLGLFGAEWELENKYVEALRDIRRDIKRGAILPPSSLGAASKSGFIYIHTPETHTTLVAPHHGAQLGFENQVTQPAESIQAQIIKCIGARPHESIKLGSKLGIVTFVFMLLVYFAGGVLIVNPIVSFFGVLACVLFWIMATVDERLNRHAS